VPWHRNLARQIATPHGKLTTRVRLVIPLPLPFLGLLASSMVSGVVIPPSFEFGDERLCDLLNRRSACVYA
jgi:hypothetical protein